MSATALSSAEMYAKSHPITIFLVTAGIFFFIGIILFAVGGAYRDTDENKSKNYTIAGMFFFTFSFTPLAAGYFSTKSVRDYIAKNQGR